MSDYNPQNERLKRDYFSYQQEARRLSEASIKAIARAISRFERFTGYADFKDFKPAQAVEFKLQLAGTLSRQTGTTLSKATVHNTLTHLKVFFHWLADQRGYRLKIRRVDADYFNVARRDVQIAAAHRERPAPSIEQINRVLEAMPGCTCLERRDRAIIAFVLLTGARDGAVISAKLKHVDLANSRFFQDAREVQTKFGKTINADFFPVGDLALSLVCGWISDLRSEMGWGDEDPLFPATRTLLGPSNVFEAAGLERKNWATTAPIREAFKQGCAAANVPYFHPHSVRKTLFLHGQRVCRTPEELKAWSQSLGHEHLLTSFTSYGHVPPMRQAELLRDIGSRRQAQRPDHEEMLRELAELVARHSSSG